MKRVLIIHEIDLASKKPTVIGVADSVENAEKKIIKDYYGEFEELMYNDIRDSNIEYTKELEVKDGLKKPYKVSITLEWFEINKV